MSSIGETGTWYTRGQSCADTATSSERPRKMLTLPTPVPACRPQGSEKTVCRLSPQTPTPAPPLPAGDSRPVQAKVRVVRRLQGPALHFLSPGTGTLTSVRTGVRSRGTSRKASKEQGQTGLGTGRQPDSNTAALTPRDPICGVSHLQHAGVDGTRCNLSRLREAEAGGSYV